MVPLVPKVKEDPQEGEVAEGVDSEVVDVVAALVEGDVVALEVGVVASEVGVAVGVVEVDVVAMAEEEVVDLEGVGVGEEDQTDSGEKGRRERRARSEQREGPLKCFSKSAVYLLSHVYRHQIPGLIILNLFSPCRQDRSRGRDRPY